MSSPVPMYGFYMLLIGRCRPFTALAYAPDFYHGIPWDYRVNFRLINSYF
jgi:hypothetical protein